MWTCKAGKKSRCVLGVRIFAVCVLRCGLYVVQPPACRAGCKKAVGVCVCEVCKKTGQCAPGLILVLRGSGVKKGGGDLCGVYVCTGVVFLKVSFDVERKGQPSWKEKSGRVRGGGGGLYICTFAWGGY